MYRKGLLPSSSEGSEYTHAGGQNDAVRDYSLLQHSQVCNNGVQIRTLGHEPQRDRTPGFWWRNMPDVHLRGTAAAQPGGASD